MNHVRCRAWRWLISRTTSGRVPSTAGWMPGATKELRISGDQASCAQTVPVTFSEADRKMIDKKMADEKMEERNMDEEYAMTSDL